MRGSSRYTSPIDVGIVRQHRHLITRDPHVELEAIGAGGEPEIERGKRVFRTDRAPAPVREDHGTTGASGEGKRLGHAVERRAIVAEGMGTPIDRAGSLHGRATAISKRASSSGAISYVCSSPG